MHTSTGLRKRIQNKILVEDKMEIIHPFLRLDIYLKHCKATKYYLLIDSLYHSTIAKCQTKMQFIFKAHRKTKCKRKTSSARTKSKWVKFAMLDSLLNTSKFQ